MNLDWSAKPLQHVVLGYPQLWVPGRSNALTQGGWGGPALTATAALSLKPGAPGIGCARASQGQGKVSEAARVNPRLRPLVRVPNVAIVGRDVVVVRVRMAVLLLPTIPSKTGVG